MREVPAPTGKEEIEARDAASAKEVHAVIKGTDCLFLRRDRENK